MTEGTSLQGHRVLVTGATGIVGSCLVHRLLATAVDVVALIRDEDPSAEFYRSGDHQRVVQVHGVVEDAAAMRRILVRHEVDVVVHLAAQTQVRHGQRDPWTTMESNVRGTYALLEAVRAVAPQIKALVVASSDKAYGDSTDLPYTESHPLAGRNIYDASKSAADLIASAYANSFALPVGIVRCGNIYGPGDLNWDRIVPGTIRSLLEGRRPTIRSDGTLRRDYVHVEDAVAAYVTLGKALVEGREHGEAFNFGTGEPVAVLDLVKEIEKAVGRTDLPPEIMSAAPNEIQDQWLDSAKASSRLGWTPSLTLSEGLRGTVDWYRRVLA